MFGQDNFGYRLQRWCTKLGFNQDPFELYEANAEREILPFFFVDRPYMHVMIGNPSHPQTAFLLAARGGGKTAAREMVAYECTHGRLRGHVLAVRYSNFDRLLEKRSSVSEINIRDHIEAIIQAAMVALTDIRPTSFDTLEGRHRKLLKGFVNKFADSRSKIELDEILQDDPVEHDWNNLSPLGLLNAFAELIVQLSPSENATFQSMYILVDQVDETPLGPQAAVPLLLPLVNQLLSLESKHVAFKFFLDDKVGDQLQQTTVNFRPDRIPVQTINWDEPALKSMVEQRLVYYSSGRVQRLDDLCVPNAKTAVNERLIKSCEGSPRILLRMCQALVHGHVTGATNYTLMERKHVLDTIIGFTHQLEVERSKVTRGSSSNLIDSEISTPRENGVCIHEGHVWVDGDLLTPPLSNLEMELFKALYERAPHIVANNTLIEKVWESSRWMHGDDMHEADEQNLRKLITRLRKHLSPDSQRFIKNARGQGYWLKVD